MTPRTIFFLIVLLLASACGAATETPTLPPAPSMSDLSTQAAATVYAGLTATALAAPPTATFTPAPTATYTPSPTATPSLDFSRARVVGVTVNYKKETLIVTIEIPDLASDTNQYSGWIGPYDYKCVRDTAYLQYLICEGHGQQAETRWTFELRQVGAEQILFSVPISIPPPPPPPSLADYQSITQCEVEPLYQPLLGWNDETLRGCYAITCYLAGGGTCGTGNSCLYMPTQPCP